MNNFPRSKTNASTDNKIQVKDTMWGHRGSVRCPFAVETGKADREAVCGKGAYSM